MFGPLPVLSPGGVNCTANPNRMARSPPNVTACDEALRIRKFVFYAGLALLDGGAIGTPPGRYSGEFDRIQRFNSVQIGQKPSMDLRMNGMNTSGGGERKWSSGSSNNIPPYPKKNEKKKQTWSPEPVSSTRNKIKASSSLEFGSP